MGDGLFVIENGSAGREEVRAEWNIVKTVQRNADFYKIFSEKFVDIFEKMRIISSCMDTKKISKIPNCGKLPDLRKMKVVVGSKQLRKAVLGGRARYVFLAENADPAITEPIEALCRDSNIQIAWVRSMAELGSACGIEVGAAAAAVVD